MQPALGGQSSGLDASVGEAVGVRSAHALWTLRLPIAKIYLRADRRTGADVDREELFQGIDDRLERMANEQRNLLQQIDDRLEQTAREQQDLFSGFGGHLEQTVEAQRGLLDRLDRTAEEQRDLLQRIDGHLERMGGERGFWDELFGTNKRLDDLVQELIRDQRELVDLNKGMNENLGRLVGDAPGWFASPREFEAVGEKLDRLRIAKGNCFARSP